MKKVQWLRKTHKWLALFAGTQILIWSLSGLYMTVVDLDVIHGDHLVNLDKPQVIDPSKLKQVSETLINELVKEHGAIKSINLKMIFGKPVYEVLTKKSRTIVDGFTGKERETVSQTVILEQANKIYAGKALISNIVLLEQYPAEIGGKSQPVWQVNYADLLHSTLYFEHHSGRLLSKRTDLWRAFDFLWILHIMEYWGSEGYEGLLFRVFSILSLLMALAGSWLLYYRIGTSNPKPDSTETNKTGSNYSNTKRFSFITTFKRMHKWFAVLIGIQLFLWVVSGLVFSFIDHKTVQGRFIFQANIDKNNQSSQITQTENLLNLTSLYPKAISITQQSLLGEGVFKISLLDDSQPSGSKLTGTTLKKSSLNSKIKNTLIDAQTNQVIIIGEPVIKQVAGKYYQGGGELIKISLVSQRDDENRGFKLPVWQLIYDDEFESHIYFSNTSGEYLGIKTESWRIFDFFMMLHFMDYSFLGLDLFGTGERGNFNNGLIIFSALALVLFAFSGMLLIFSGFSKSDFTGLMNGFISSNKVTIKLTDKSGATKVIKTERHHRLMDVLVDNNIELDSICGGGGICGCCRVKLQGESCSNQELSEHDYLECDELKAGYRLACQLSVVTDMSVEVPNGVL